MALQYLGLDARGTKEASAASDSRKPARTSMGKIVLLALANIAMLAFAGRLLLKWKGAEIAEAVGWKNTSVSSVLSSKGVISGILHNGENPAIIINGLVLHEGDVFDECKIVKIYPDRVDIEMHGQSITKTVGQ